jgi:hypothetical protein
VFSVHTNTTHPASAGFVLAGRQESRGAFVEHTFFSTLIECQSFFMELLLDTLYFQYLL